MTYPPALLAVMEKTLKTTRFGIDDLLALEIGVWHAAVLFDDTEHLRLFALAAMSERDRAENTPLDIAYRLNRTIWIDRLEAFGAEGDKALLDWKGLGSFLTPVNHDRLPSKRGIIKALANRYRQGRSLNDRDAAGNTPLHWLAVHGHSKAANYFANHYRTFCLDLSARNNEGHTARDVARLAGHHDIAAQLLIREIDNYLGAAYIWQQMCADRSSYSRS
ncbi:ankyrin repeat domain-containing protein [Pseudomonas asiatica]|uniref:ankyrin repeat domain-containing protein n=1 Tax=Pseudomonas TaxID=286 RepID=UPI0012CAB53C|nr:MULTISPECIES: ankyrin repeat domain-containing protein [Pseudomonas]MCE0849497.1 ankyrin repeat domain-containing protein [Pseudomonas asiatica]MPT16034.1 ankyrin repeat domain-containing protein [Microbacterium sp.]